METPDTPRRKKRWTLWDAFTLLTAVVIGLLILSSLFTGSVELKAAKRAKLANEFSQVQTAVLAYYTEYSEYPVAPDNATLIKKLSGDSPRHIQFISVKSSDQNPQGALLDPWGTPLQLSVDADGVLHARSAGPDRIFGTADDIVGKFNATDVTGGK